MKDNELMHHGVLGMKWGVRKVRPTSGKSSKKRTTSTVKSDNKKVRKSKGKPSSPQTKTVKDLSDAELRDKINRLELEKRYKDLSKSPPKPSSKGKAFVMDVLEKSGKNIATQLTTYAMGTAVNKMLKNVFDDDAIVNPKKGQKDK